MKPIVNTRCEDFEGGQVVVANFATTTQHDAIVGKTQTHMIKYYNLDVVYFAEALDESARDPERVPSASVIPLVTNIDEIRKFMTVRTGEDE